MKKKLPLLVYLFSFLLFFLRSGITIDPDFGWHVQLGNIILHKGIQYTDPFSYTMPHFPLVDYEWLSNVLIYVLLQHGGYVLLALLFAMLATAALIMATRLFALKNNFILSLYIFFGGGILFDFTGIRVQVITWFFFAVLLQLLFHYQKRKVFWLTPLLFLLWANLHAGFAIGIAVFALFFFVESWEQRNIRWITGIVLLLTIASTFLNPYGVRLWEETFRQLGDTSMHFTILEWLPPIFFINIPVFWFFFAFSTVFVYTYRKRFSFIQLTLYCMLLLMALSSIRHIPFWLYIALPMSAQGVSWFSQDVTRDTPRRRRYLLMVRVFFVLLSFFVVGQVICSYLEVFSQRGATYPAQEVAYLQKHTPNGNIFSTYTWGGYLIWKLPHKKVFIDGLMPSWRQQIHSFSESTNAFADYQAIFSNSQTLDALIKKYDITTFLLPTSVLFPPKNIRTNTILTASLLSLGENSKTINFSIVLHRLGFIKVYAGEDGIIYEKK